MTIDQEELQREQTYFDLAWEARERSRNTLMGVGAAAGGPNKTAAAVQRAGQARAEQLGAPDEPVAFGRVDRGDEHLYIGLHSITNDDRDVLVVNWQAPAAESFYKSTVQDPLGVARKRTYTTKQNTILDFSDVVYEQLAAAVEELTAKESWGIDDAVLRDLETRRTGEMRDIVQTIHASQFDLIRSPLDELLIIQGGPGTGKTAIALHRISWLLYNYRDDLEPADCLVIGPNPTFTRYIKAVLPGLGDRDVVYRDLRALGPQQSTGPEEHHEVARLKGEERMAALLARSLRQRVRFPANTDTLVVGVGPAAPTFSRGEIEAEIRRLLNMNYNAGRAGLRAYLQRQSRARSRGSLDVPATVIDNALERVWPQLTPQAALRDLLASRDRLLTAADAHDVEFTVTEIRRLVRIPQERLANEPWTDADIPLLDELSELINGTPEKYDHIVVDEAQDLSAMQLRSIRRRSRRGSMTIVGDIAQSTGAWARDDWTDVAAALQQEAPCATHELSLGYRVPRQVFEFAARLLPSAAPSVTPPRVVRDGPAEPELLEVETSDIAKCTATAAQDHAGKGRFVGVICPETLREAVIAELAHDHVNFANVREGELGKSINLASAEEAKGLEFDAVIVVQPEDIVAEDKQGQRMLYVAFTRTTQYLTVVHDGVAMPIGEGVSGSVQPAAPVATIEERPHSVEEVRSVAVTSDISRSPHASASSQRDEVAATSLPTGTIRSHPQPGGLSERAARAAGREVAQELRDVVQPALYATMLDELRRELGVSADDILDLLTD